MSLYLKTEPMFIDKRIQSLQNYIWSELDGLQSSWSSYGRCYKNPKAGTREFVPEFYTGSNNYKDVLFNDKVYLSTFFLVGDSVIVEGRTYTHTVDFFVQARLNKLFNTTHRADAELDNTILQVIEKNPYGFDITDVTHGISNIYNGMDTSLIDFTDMSDFYCMKVTMDVTVTTDNNC